MVGVRCRAWGKQVGTGPRLAKMSRLFPMLSSTSCVVSGLQGTMKMPQ